MREVVVVGAGMTAFGRHPDIGLSALAAPAIGEALLDAAVAPAQVDAVFAANAVGGLIIGQEMIRGQAMLRDTGISEIPVFAVENACASGSSAMHLAWLSVASGLHDVVVVVGAEQMSHHDKRRSFAAISTAVDIEDRAELVARLGADESRRTLFMDLYANEARRYLEQSDATVAHLANVVVKARQWGSLNDRAQFRSRLTRDEVLSHRSIVWPLTLPMCSAIGDGAAALVLAAVDEQRSARRNRREHRPDVRVVASVMQSGKRSLEGRTAASRAAEMAYERSGLGPTDLHVIEVHDAAASAELSAYEDLGLAPTGEGWRLVEDGTTAIGGRLPVNTSGGLLSRGHPIGATGIAQIVEVVLQLRGEAGPRQVPGARIGLTQNNGGWLVHDNAASSVHIFSTV